MLSEFSSPFDPEGKPSTTAKLTTGKPALLSETTRGSEDCLMSRPEASTLACALPIERWPQVVPLWRYCIVLYCVGRW